MAGAAAVYDSVASRANAYVSRVVNLTGLRASPAVLLY